MQTAKAFAPACSSSINHRTTPLSATINIDRESEASVETPGDTSNPPLRTIVPVICHGEEIKGSVVLRAPPGHTRVLGGAHPPI